MSTLLSTLTVTDVALLVVGGVVAGALNFAAAGGSLVSFLVLGAVGVPPQVANATNLLATPASFLAAIPGAVRERRELVRRWPVFMTAIVGTVLGVYAFYMVPPAGFRKAIPILLLLGTATLIVHPMIKRRIEQRHAKGERHDHMGLITVGVFLTSVYAGFFGAAVGVLVLIVIGTFAAWPWLEANRLKNLVCLVTSAIGFLGYIMTGLVDGPIAALLFVSLGVGGLVGRALITRLPRGDVESVLRQVVAAGAAFGAGVLIST